MTITPVSPQLQLVATLGLAGAAKQNGTPIFLSYTFPNDGQMHRFIVLASEQVTVAETGGGVGLNLTVPGGAVQNAGTALFAGAKTIGGYHASDGGLVQAGSVLQVDQSAALTAGACTVWAEIWAD